MFSKKLVITVGLTVLMVCCFIWISLSSRYPADTEGGNTVMVTLVAPVQKISAESTRFIQDIWRHYFSLIATAHENDNLKKQLRRANAHANKCIEIELSNKRLRTFLDFKKTTDAQVIAAEVVGKDPSHWFKSIIIDKGERAGVVKGLPVVIPDGIVGQVVMSTAQYAKVQLMIDRNSAVDSLVQRSRARGIVQGKSADRCQFQYVLRKDDVKLGDIVITSGLDGVYPKGLRVGKVSSLVRRNAGIFQDVEVTPSVDFKKLEEVLVILYNHPNWTEDK
ncbi:MAG: rod shape-determining protein MreC [Thermodesulfobacteriota bacterium]